MGFMIDASRYHKKWALSIIHRRRIISDGIFVIFCNYLNYYPFRDRAAGFPE
jgi:hypothetical protein